MAVTRRSSRSRSCSRGKSPSRSIPAIKSISKTSKKSPSYWIQFTEFVTPFRFSLLILLLETILCTLIILKIPYTEIDWKAYMEEVTGYVEGERDYVNLKGGTGPLVYPALFLYIYQGLRYITSSGENILKAQFIFMFIYLLNRIIVMRIYYKVFNKSCQFYVSIVVLSLSKRIHSLYILRLFNDTITNLLINLAILLFLSSYWNIGSLFFSAGVGVKMNGLLYAPGVLGVYLGGRSYSKLRSIQSQIYQLRHTLLNLFINALLQIIIGYPFLSTYPLSYLRKSFELDRIFFYKWTVNFKFLPEGIFINPTWGKILLGGHVLVLVLFEGKIWGIKPFKIVKMGKEGDVKLSAGYIALVCYLSNFIGITFLRTIHYQFYSWYYDSLPLLIFSTLCTPIGIKDFLKVSFIFGGIMGGVEYAFNVYPATPFSSGVIQVAHFTLLGRLWFYGKIPGEKMK
ncbi:hypothetical protein TrLO_g15073 [Triparma laevis f. longispina]|uniref:dolichyl-P-Man:Man5GlcNAc2-PP-dolichol alpha-1,3-mannosyltransferase n=1 Tax=Triparma laevis f. longispina TaxID=1714387 RepID=A0A9W7AF95_9STRA|nr:hypothetical protein TrLO_g15073 [Triparma laevis f. longispina]